MKRILSWAANSILLLFAAFIFLLGYSLLEAKENPDKVPSVMGYSSTSVLSSNMSPVLESGDMIIIKVVTPDKVKMNDIITYKVNKDILISHRVVKILEKDGQAMFQTKGDANNVEDTRLVSQNQLVGIFSYKIPYGGYVLTFAKSTVGFIILIALPIGLIMGSELKIILFEWVKENHLKKTAG